MMKVSFGHSVCALAVSHNKCNLVSTAEIYQANYRGGKKPLLRFEYTHVVLCPVEKTELEIIFCSNMGLILQNASKVWFTA